MIYFGPTDKFWGISMKSGVPMRSSDRAYGGIPDVL